MTDRDPAASAAAVSRGMHALLASRDAALAAGAAPVGWKIGFNTPAIQEHFGLTDAVVGYLTDAGVSPDGATVPLAGWSAPAVEVEIAIRVGARGAVAGLAPALELVDLDISFDDIEPVLAGNICHRGVIFGEEVPGVDPWAVVASVTRAGDVVAEGRPVEDPATTVEFVGSYLAAHGTALAAGDRIIAGSVVAPVAVVPGDELSVSFGPLGQLSVGFGD
jgi:2-keto-4-pentenoate hydratase